MKTRALAFPLVVAVAFTTAAPRLHAGQIRREKVPPAVLQAFEHSFPKATVSTYLLEKKQGKVFYEIQSMDVVGTRDVVYAADGTMVEMREGLVLGGLPEAVVKAVEKQHPGGVITNAVRITHGAGVGYEVTVRTAGKTIAMTVSGPPPAQPPSTPKSTATP